MPQITIEYSSNIAESFEALPLARQVHKHLIEFADADLNACKTRLVHQRSTAIGDGSPDKAMIHIDLRVLPGRSDQQKRLLGEAVSATLSAAVDKPPHLDLQLTVEVRELDGANYYKTHLSPSPVGEAGTQANGLGG